MLSSRTALALVAVTSLSLAACGKPQTPEPQDGPPPPPTEQTEEVAGPADLDEPDVEEGDEQAAPAIPCPEPKAPSAREPAAFAPDSSAAFEAGSGEAYAQPMGVEAGERKVCGKVIELQKIPGRWRVVLSGPGPVDDRSFLLELPENVPLPLSVGDVIGATLNLKVVKIHRTLEGTIVDEKGKLLLGFSQDGNASFAPGWTFSRGRVVSTDKPHAADGARRQTHRVKLGYQGKVADAEPNTWRKLATDDGEWVVVGSAVSWTQGKLPPDAGDHASFTVVRLAKPKKPAEAPALPEAAAEPKSEAEPKPEPESK